MKTFRRVLSTVAAMVLLSATVSVSAALPSASAVIGDVNGDGVVNTTDARLVLQHAVGKTSLDETALKPADVNADGVVDTTDARLVLQYAVGLLEAFPGSDLEPFVEPDMLLGPYTADKIRQSYLETFLGNVPGAVPADVTIAKFYGIYHGCAVVMMTDAYTNYTEAEIHIEIGGVWFHYRNGNQLLVWREGGFYSLPDACEQGLLTKAELKHIADRHHTSATGTILEPLPPLTEVQTAKIQSDFIRYREENNIRIDSITGVPDIQIFSYFGTWDGREVVALRDRDAVCHPMFRDYTVAGYTISLPNYDDQLLVHDGDTFLELQEAFDAGLLTRQDIRLIQKYSRFAI